MLTSQVPGLYLMEDEEKGRGVYTTNALEKGDLIEYCPVIILSAEDTSSIYKTKLHDYYFVWSLEDKTSAIALGYGSLYNHAENANAEFETDVANRRINIIAKHAISAHEEINLHYHSGNKADYELWFEAK